ncbi:hypothetical protein [Mucilaginibacter sp. FT3.2]|uniref:hypothetical protein n=1 Tax=Mucilaginibacter sp. FT3.2 TaxID=2723090 RepID=UPI00160FB253|nr:hypothetical protein [Mucilaginibacter sp. FT3.2]MBB6234512.1 hypothetical protein [Mucilaginibacter sp. FT3.2]
MSLTPIQKIDIVLSILRDNKPYHRNSLTEKLIEKGIEYTDAELRIALRQANEDGYIYSEPHTGNITITLKGYMFVGYEQQAIDDARNEDRVRKNERWVLRATWAAAIVGFLVLSWYVLIWFCPHPHDCFYRR